MVGTCRGDKQVRESSVSFTDEHRTKPEIGRPADLRSAVAALGNFAATATLEDLPAHLRERLQLSLIDNLGLTIAGHRIGEVQSVVRAWDPQPGPAQLFGTGIRTQVQDAAWLNGIAVCVNELDEGNKNARGHPVTHVISAALAIATERHVSGTALLEAVMVGGEISSRFGRALQPAPGLHTHGHWGNAGAAAAVARLMQLDGSEVAGAIDAAGGLVLATSFETALRGTFVRNTWLGAANVLGIVAARLAAAGVANVDGTAESTLGSLLGHLEPDLLVDELGRRWDTGTGYFKRHASCSYTHPPADVALELRRELGTLQAEDVASIEIETNVLAAPLARTELPTRLSAMFSIPHVVAVALLYGDCGPERFDEQHRREPSVRRLVDVTSVRRSEAMDARLPAERAARVTLSLVDGRTLAAEAPNPVGDADHHPFGREEILAKIDGVLSGADISASDIAAVVDELPGAPDVAPLLARLS
jgi:2-methylcitrate dehydratase PrpD